MTQSTIEHKNKPVDLTPKVAEKNTSLLDEKRANLKYQYEKDREMVKGIFKFYEVEGGTLSFSLKLYKEEVDATRYDLIDGQMYTIPLGVAKHLNKNGWYPMHVFSTDVDGKPLQKIGQKIRRFGFISTEFMDLTDYEAPQRIITVENIAPLGR